MIKHVFAKVVRGFFCKDVREKTAWQCPSVGCLSMIYHSPVQSRTGQESCGLECDFLFFPFMFAQHTLTFTDPCLLNLSLSTRNKTAKPLDSIGKKQTEGYNNFRKGLLVLLAFQSLVVHEDENENRFMENHSK